MENNILFYEESSINPDSDSKQNKQSLLNQEQLEINPIPIDDIEKITSHRTHPQPKCKPFSSIELDHLKLDIDDEDSLDDLEELQMIDLFAFSKSQIIKNLHGPKQETKLSIGKAKNPSILKVTRRESRNLSKKSLFGSKIRKAQTLINKEMATKI